LGSRDVIGHVTIRLPAIDFICVVHSDHASILHSYGDMAPQMLDARTGTWKERWKKENERGRERGKESKGKIKRERKGKGKNGS